MVQYFIKIWKIYQEKNLQPVSGQVAYFMILSLFPLLLVFITIISYMEWPWVTLLYNFSYLFPEDTFLYIVETAEEIFSRRSPALLSLSTLLAVWASLRGIHALIRGICRAYGLNENKISFFRFRWTALLFLFFLTVAIFFSFVLTVFGENIGRWIFAILGAGHPVAFLWQQFRSLTNWFFLVLVFTILYRLATNRQIPYRHLIPGAFFSAFGWLALSWGFSVYVGYFSHYSPTYGSIGGIIISLLWLYWNCELILIGGALNAVLADNSK